MPTIKAACKSHCASTLLCASVSLRCCCNLKAQSFIEKDLFPLDVRAPVDKKIPQLGRIVMTAERGVESEKNFTARGEMSLQIVQKKIPFDWSPESLCWIGKLKIDGESRDPIEFLIEIGQRLERFDPPNDAPNVEKIKQLAEKRELIYVQTEDGMTK